MTRERTPQQQLDLVRQRYGSIAEGENQSCCTPGDQPVDLGPAVPVDLREAARTLGYTEAQLAALPEDQSLTLGCGNPLSAALLEPGQTVLDLGAGAGFDCFIAAESVGAEGQVIGVDMTPSMIARARAAASDAGRTNVEFRLGELSHLPVADGTVDVILSNCVINLVPDQAQVYREARRVLKTGGRLAISDVVRIGDFPPEIKASDSSLCSCISGAASVSEVEAFLREAGFEDIRIVVNERSDEYIKDWDPGSGAEQYVRAAIIEARK